MHDAELETEVAVRFVLALALVLLTWGLVDLWAHARFGHDELSRARREQRWDAQPLGKTTSSVDFSLRTITCRGEELDFLFPPAPVAILLTSTGALTIVLLVVGQWRREGPAPRPRSLRREVIDG